MKTIPITLTSDSTLTVRYTAVGNGSLEGHVYEVSIESPGTAYSKKIRKPAVGATVAVTAFGETHSGTTESDGSYRIEGIPAGNWSAKCTWEGREVNIRVVIEEDKVKTQDWMFYPYDGFENTENVTIRHR